MNHDITHCSGHDLMGTTSAPVICQKRDTCHRYKAYKELEQKENFQVSMVLPFDCMNNNHAMYWDIGETREIHLGDMHDETDVLPTREGGYTDD